MASAYKHVLLIALSYNLKKLMKFSRSKAKIISNVLQNPNIKGSELLHFLSEVIKDYSLQFKPSKFRFTKTVF